MSIEPIFAAVQADMIDAISKAGDKLPNFGLGNNAFYRREALPRVVWVPMSSNVRGPAQRGNGTDNPRALFTREVHIEAHVWAGDVTAVETLMNQMVASTYLVLGGWFKPLSERWEMQEDLTSGIECVLTIQIAIPFTDTRQKTVQPLTVPLTKEFAS